jgi:serine phosphatase RsbU (regulator of sigma subunit)
VPAPPDENRAGFSASTGADVVRVQQLAKVTSELAAADTIEAVVEAAVNHAAEAIQAAVTTLMLRQDDQLVLVGGFGLRPGVSEQWHSFPVEHSNPASEAVQLARPILLNDHDEIEQRYGSFVNEVPAGRSVICLPLGVGAEPVGAAGLTFDSGWLPGPQELDLLMTFADACGQAIRRIRAADEAAERSRQLTFLADASAELASSLDYRSTLAKVASLCVPVLADWCAVDMIERDTLTTLAVAHVDPAKVAWAWELQRRYPPDPNAPNGAATVIRTGVSEIYPDITDEMLVAGARDEEHLRLSRELDLRSAIVVPLKVHDRTLGAITLIRAETDRRYDAADLVIAEDLGRRAAMAIDNAQLHSVTQDVARQLQLAVLPDRLDGIPGWAVAAHYEPGGRGEVGGDFYDAIALPDGRIVVFVGDVMGHGVSAAAAMAQLRSSVRAFLSIDPSPAAVLERLDTMFAMLAIPQLVSLVYAVIDRAAGRLTVANAGHYPPFLVREGGEVETAETTRRRLLGADPDHCTESHFPFGPADTLLMVTDGLFERRGEHIDIGLERVRSAAGALAGAELRTGLAALVAGVHQADADDDVTAVAVRAS